VSQTRFSEVESTELLTTLLKRRKIFSFYLENQFLEQYKASKIATDRYIVAKMRYEMKCQIERSGNNSQLVDRGSKLLVIRKPHLNIWNTSFQFQLVNSTA